VNWAISWLGYRTGLARSFGIAWSPLSSCRSFLHVTIYGGLDGPRPGLLIATTWLLAHKKKPVLWPPRHRRKLRCRIRLRSSRWINRCHGASPGRSSTALQCRGGQSGPTWKLSNPKLMANSRSAKTADVPKPLPFPCSRPNRRPPRNKAESKPAGSLPILTR
jgi:hypothetical protein